MSCQNRVRREEEVKGEAGPVSFLSLEDMPSPTEVETPQVEIPQVIVGSSPQLETPLVVGTLFSMRQRFYKWWCPPCHEWSLLTKEDPLISPMA